MTLQNRLSVLEHGRARIAQPDYCALSDTDISLLVRAYEGESITAAERAEACRLENMIGNRDARTWAHLSDAELAKRIAQYA